MTGRACGQGGRDGVPRAALHLLDGFELESGGEPITVPRSTERLLALLALHPHSHREVVAGTLWPEVSERQALASLRTSLWRINRIVPELVVVDGQTVTLSSSAEVDTTEQEAFVIVLLRAQRLDVSWVEDGLGALWPRQLLPGWYEDWVVVERERLNQLRMHALERAARMLVDHGNVDGALDLAVEAVRSEPLRESANEQLIRVHLARGNVYDALRQFHQYRRLVAVELDAHPSGSLLSLVAPWMSARSGRV